jgi:hypothetical protein
MESSQELIVPNVAPDWILPSALEEIGMGSFADIDAVPVVQALLWDIAEVDRKCVKRQPTTLAEVTFKKENREKVIETLKKNPRLSVFNTLFETSILVRLESEFVDRKFKLHG